MASGPGLGQNQTVAELEVQVINTPELTIQILFNCDLRPCLNWVGCRQIVRQIHL